MNTFRTPRVASLRALLLCLAALLPSNLTRAADLEVSIRPHVRRIFFGDPLYVQVSIVNRSERVVTGPTPRLDGTNFVFYVYDPNKDSPDSPVPQVAVGGPVSVAKTVQFEPGKPMHFNCYLFLPDLLGFDEPFYKPFRRGENVGVQGQYRYGPVQVASSRAETVRIDGRDQDEMCLLERWAKAEPLGDGKGPGPRDFGMQFQGPLSRQQVSELADRIKTGELADLLRLTIQLQDLYAAPPESREAGHRSLDEWLSKHPDVMRETLREHVRTILETYSMSPPMDAKGAVD